MCGIFGYINSNPEHSVLPEILRSMGDLLVHRGPNGSGFYVKKNVGLGHSRLAIMDLERGNQPITNETEDIVLSFNGEIYNYLHLREQLKRKGHVFRTNLDCEVLVHLYEEERDQCFNQINGMYSFCLWDGKEKKFFLCRDRFGIKPLYYCQADDSFIFASEPRSLLTHPAVKREIDPSAMHYYFVYGYVPEPVSIFSSIKKVPSASYVTLHQKKVFSKRYWSSSFMPIQHGNTKRFQEKLITLLEDSVKLRLMSEVPLGVFLSGGIDSSVIGYLAAQRMSQRIKTFSIYNDDKDYDESYYSKMISDCLGSDHVTREVTGREIKEKSRAILEALDEPIADASFISTYFLSELASNHVKVCLGGDGGDELFAGYPTYCIHTLADMYQKTPFVARQVFAKLFSQINRSFIRHNRTYLLLNSFMRGALHKGIERNIMWFGYFLPCQRTSLFTPAVNAAFADDDIFGVVRDFLNKQNTKSFLSQQLRVDRHFYLTNNILAKIDRASMANSLEVRVPYLDYRLVEFIDCLPDSYKIRRGITKYILRNAFYKKIPRAIIRRSKRGFNIGINKLLTQGLLDEFSDLIHQDFIKKQGLFNFCYVKTLINDHLKYKADNSRQIWALLVFQTWYQKHFQNTSETTVRQNVITKR